ncbi:MAG: lipase maturation factor family protein [Gammaproteobacteria bacterium]|nr:lipase maturation factor family protein [Gammaproteobacteria bacterium]
MSAAPELVYDGDCTFCAAWVRYWARRGGTHIAYRPLQVAAADHPTVAPADFVAAIHLFEPDGRHTRGAAAAFRVLALTGAPLWWWLYLRSGLFARASEGAYRGVARRRGAAFAAMRLLWGDERHPATYAVASALFLRLVALVYLAAFASLGSQVVGLLGAHGILPAGEFLAAARAAFGPGAWLRFPSLFWLGVSDGALLGACVAGGLAAVAAACGYRVLPALAACYLLYLSLFSVGQDFLAFQWDLLLLEAGFLALFLRIGSPWIPRLFRLLLFRFMFLAGCVKLLSGDPTWQHLAALDFHYETQPLPTPLAWYMHQLPRWFDHLCVAGTFVVELVLPWLIFAPRRPRMLAAAGIALLELGILLTGNYNFFNLLTLALLVFLFDDAQFGRAPAAATRRGTLARALLGAGLAVMLALNLLHLARPFGTTALTRALAVAAVPFEPWRIVNAYGVFAVMTTTRPEIVVEASQDGRTWRPYRFRYKPGDPTRAPRWNIPHQPRLDWQMWFAALGDAGHTPWFGNFLVRLLAAEPSVLALLREAPFGARRPRFVRARLYDYRFTDRAERARKGAVWRREPLGLYYPPVRLP